jgi:hypothetical protein
MGKRKGSDSGELDFPSPTEAHHNKDGFYTMTDPKPGEFDSSREVQLESGIYLEMPDMKEFRILWIDTENGHFQIECDETYEELKDMLASAARHESEWYSVTDPTYGHSNEIPATVLQHPIAIVSQWRDMEELRKQINAAKMQRRLQRIQEAKQGGISENVKQILKRSQN